MLSFLFYLHFQVNILGKTSTQLQAEMAERKKEAGQKRVGLWLDSKITAQAKLLAGMNQTDTLTHAIRLGLHTMDLLKKHDHTLYVDLVAGELSQIQLQLDLAFPQEPTSHATA
jgi:hypothetical protein